jgi:hypothetical protein
MDGQNSANYAPVTHPHHLHAQLKARAKREQRSVAQEAIRLLAAAKEQRAGAGPSARCAASWLNHNSATFVHGTHLNRSCS